MAPWGGGKFCKRVRKFSSKDAKGNHWIRRDATIKIGGFENIFEETEAEWLEKPNPSIFGSAHQAGSQEDDCLGCRWQNNMDRNARSPPSSIFVPSDPTTWTYVLDMRVDTAGLV